MCAVDDAEPSTLTHTIMRRAVRIHGCGECARHIQPGEQYERVAMLYEGKWWSGATCKHCLAARSWLHAMCDGWLYEGVREDLEEHLHEYNDPWLRLYSAGIAGGWDGGNGPLPAHAPSAAVLALWATGPLRRWDDEGEQIERWQSADVAAALAGVELSDADRDLLPDLSDEWARVKTIAELT